MTIGIGVMLHSLGGGSPKSPSAYYGRTIKSVEQTGDDLRLTFEDGVTVRVYDGGQSCCEERYMETPDDLSALIGKKLLALEVNEAKTSAWVPPEVHYGEHEAAFLDIKTEDGVAVTFSFHNEHNGYYGGFGLSLDEVVSQ